MSVSKAVRSFEVSRTIYFRCMEPPGYDEHDHIHPGKQLMLYVSNAGGHASSALRPVFFIRRRTADLEHE